MLSILQRLLPEARIEEAGDLAGSSPGWRRRAARFADPRPAFPRPDPHRDARRLAPPVPAHHPDRRLDGRRPAAHRRSDEAQGRRLPRQEHRARGTRPGDSGHPRRGSAGALRTLRSPAAAAQPAPGGLTERQLDVLRLLAQGKSNRRSAAPWTSPTTRCASMSSLLRALDVPSRTAAAVKYRALLGQRMRSSTSWARRGCAEARGCFNGALSMAKETDTRSRACQRSPAPACCSAAAQVRRGQRQPVLGKDAECLELFARSNARCTATSARTNAKSRRRVRRAGTHRLRGSRCRLPAQGHRERCAIDTTYVTGVFGEAGRWLQKARAKAAKP